MVTDEDGCPCVSPATPQRVRSRRNLTAAENGHAHGHEHGDDEHEHDHSEEDGP